jgi:hypothetical protein
MPRTMITDGVHIQIQHAQTSIDLQCTTDLPCAMLTKPVPT